MIDKAFDSLKSRSLVDWGVILLGVQGPFGMAWGRLSGQPVEGFATEELAVAQPDAPAFDAIAALALDANLPSDERQHLVETICQTQGIDMALSMRKWRVAIVECTLSNIDTNPLYAQIELLEVWSKFGWPDDAPISMRKGASTQSSEGFGSLVAFSQLKRETENWLTAEFIALK